jgi:hypothetical protein
VQHCLVGSEMCIRDSGKAVRELSVGDVKAAIDALR